MTDDLIRMFNRQYAATLVGKRVSVSNDSGGFVNAFLVQYATTDINGSWMVVSPAGQTYDIAYVRKVEAI